MKIEAPLPHDIDLELAIRATGEDNYAIVHITALRAWHKRLQDAFDFGFKAAGGTTIPDEARDMVDLALSRDQIEILASFADNVVDDTMDRNYDSAPILRAFLETVSIYRSKK